MRDQQTDRQALVLTKPTNERLLQLCAQYGDDVVINPPDSVPEP